MRTPRVRSGEIRADERRRPRRGRRVGESRASLGVVGDGDDCPDPPADAPQKVPEETFELPPAGESSPAERDARTNRPRRRR